VETARSLDAALIVLAGRPGAGTPGTVSLHVLRHAPCPVLFVPPSGAGHRTLV
jgi:nucleotide-binding universal stress UspA family protein